MKRFAQEVKATGAKPVLVTPLSRRGFDKAGHIRDTLQPWADADKQVAKEESIPVLDLLADSIAALEKMGPDEANTLAMAPPPAKDASGQVIAPTTTVERKGEAREVFDGTHLGAKGAAFFAHIVEAELARALPELKACFK
jgi:lysophospholipase L1-like esterase